MPLVSICIPTYKQVEYLKKCLESILTQDFFDYEIIISDDTPDNSVKFFVEEYLKGKSYRYYRNQISLGSPKNWNNTITKATGKYIKIMHHDDYFMHTYSLRKMVTAIEKNNGDFAFCSSEVIFSKTKKTSKIHFVSAKQLRLIKKNPYLLFYKNFIGPPSSIIHRNYNLFYDVEFIWLVDVDFYIQQILSNNKIIQIKEPLITITHEGQGQITQAVENDIKIQISEHVRLFNKFNIKPSSSFYSFFDYLFHKYKIESFEKLIDIEPQAILNENFYRKVIFNLNKYRTWKWLKKRMYESRYNNYIFKLEQFT